MSQCVTKLPHSCGSRDALQVFADEEGNLSGYCFSCGTYVADPLGKGKSITDIPEKQRLGKTREQIEEEMEVMANCEAIDLPDRKLRKRALDYYNIGIGVSEQDGHTPTYHFYPYTKDGVVVRYKVRHIETKRMWAVGFEKDVDLFGWEQAIATGAKRLIITEGELDAAALKTILQRYTKESYIDYIPAVCSLPNGASAAGKDLARLMPQIRKHFKEVSFCFDSDEAGQQAIEDACKIVPDATVVTLPSKDANACLIEGKGKAAHAATIFNADKPKNTRLVFGEDLHEEAKEAAEFGVSWPWKGMTEMTRGIRTGETIYIGAAQKMGKSEIVNALAKHLIVEHGWKVMMCKPEEANKKSYKMILGKVAGTTFTDPKVTFDEAAYDKAGKAVKGKLAMLNLYQHVGWESLQADIRSAASWGAKAIFVDPLTQLSNGLSAAEANTKLQEVAQELASMALDLDMVIFIFCHLRNPDSGDPHDRGGKVLTSQFAGSRAMGRSCNYMIGLEGNKDPDLSDEERNMRKLVLLDDREFGEVGEVSLYWNRKTTLFNEVNDAS
jgi:twinkle protein